MSGSAHFESSSSGITAPSGQSDARYGTTAAWAQAEASTAKLSKEVGQNAAQMQNAAHEAASEAQENEPQAVYAVNQLEAGRATDQAAAQGKLDVESAKAAAANAVDQARSMANSAYQTAQSLFNGQMQEGSTTDQLSSTVQSTASSAFQTGKEYLASAQTIVQPHIEKAKNMVSDATFSTTASGKPDEVAATTAPLESGNQIVGNPYPATTTGQSTKVGEV